MAWTLDDAKDIAAIATAAAQVLAALNRFRERHLLDVGGPDLLREQHIEDDAHHIERHAEVLRRRFGGE